MEMKVAFPPPIDSRLVKERLSTESVMAWLNKYAGALSADAEKSRPDIGRLACSSSAKLVMAKPGRLGCY